MSIVTKRLDGSRIQDATWYEARARPRPHCVRWVPAPLTRKRSTTLNPQFLVDVYCGPPNGRPSQLLLSTCLGQCNGIKRQLSNVRYHCQCQSRLSVVHNCKAYNALCNDSKNKSIKITRWLIEVPEKWPHCK